MIRQAIYSSSLKSCCSAGTSATARKSQGISPLHRTLLQLNHNHHHLQRKQQRQLLSTMTRTNHATKQRQTTSQRQQQHQPSRKMQRNNDRYRNESQRSKNQQKQRGYQNRKKQKDQQPRSPMKKEDSKQQSRPQPQKAKSSTQKILSKEEKINLSKQQMQEQEELNNAIINTNLSKLSKIMSTFLKRRQALPPPSYLSQNPNENDENEIKRRELYQDTLKFVQILQTAVDNESISTNGKAVLALNDLLGNALIIYSESPPPLEEAEETEEKTGVVRTTTTPYEACMDVIHLLQKLNLDIQPSHYSCTVTSAVHCGNWVEGATLFRMQIDPDEGGLVPMDSTMKMGGGDEGGMIVGPVEMGLYAIAMSSRESGGEEDVATKVFEATMNMCMVSPTDQEKYILSAGLALGRAGEYKSCVDFWESGLHNDTLGQPLIAATMIACLKSFQYDEALRVYHNAYLPSSNNNQQQLVSGTEWQWGGQSNTIHPSCIDSALRAMGGLTLGSYDTISPPPNDEERAELTWGNSEHALQLLLQLINNEEPVSVSAIEGVLLACERDGDWRAATGILDLLLHSIETNEIQNDGEKGILVVDDILTASQTSFHGSGRNKVESNENNIKSDTITANMLASVMRTCNANHEFGLALMYGRHVGLALSHVDGKANNISDKVEEESSDALIVSEDTHSPSDVDINSSVEKKNADNARLGTITSQPFLTHHPNVLTATMVSLCGLRCYGDALELHEAALASDNFVNIDKGYWHDVLEDCYTYAQDMIEERQTKNIDKDEDDDKAKAWISASKHLHRLSTVLHSIQHKNGEGYVAVSHPKGEKVIAQALAKAVRHCTKAGQEETGLHVAQQTSTIIKAASSSSSSSRPRKSSSSVKERIKRFFGLDDASNDDNVNFTMNFDDNQIDPGFITSTDSLLASTMEAYRAVNRDKDALDLFVLKYEQIHETESRRTSDKEKLTTGDIGSDLMVESVNEALRTFFKMNNHEDAKSLFHSLDTSSRTPETYVIMATSLVDKEPWTGEMSELYQSAVQSNCLTEELAFLAMKSVVFSKLDGKMRILRDIVDDISSLLNISPEEFNWTRYWELKRTLGYRFAKLLMWWRNLSSSWEKEFTLSIKQLKEGRRKGYIIDEDALRCIVKFAGHNQRDHKSRGKPLPDAENDEEQRIQNKQRHDGIRLIRDALVDARKTSLCDSPAFVEDVVVGFRALKASDECVDFIKEIHSRNVISMKPSTYEHGIYAAEENNDLMAVEEMTGLKEDAYHVDAK